VHGVVAEQEDFIVNETFVHRVSATYELRFNVHC